MTKIVKKYNYTVYDRVNQDGQRLYLTEDGQKLPSVTTILGATKSEEDKKSLQNWRRSIGEARATEITVQAGNRGTKMHKFLENYIETAVWPTVGTHPMAQQAHRMAEKIRTHALCDVDEIWGSEISLRMPGMYAGTTDLVGTYSGKPAIMDFKQSNRPKKSEWITDYYLQLVAYAEAHNESYGTDIKEGHVFICTVDCEYQQFDIWPDDYARWREQWYERVYQYYEQYQPA